MNEATEVLIPAVAVAEPLADQPTSVAPAAEKNQAPRRGQLAGGTAPLLAGVVE